MFGIGRREPETPVRAGLERKNLHDSVGVQRPVDMREWLIRVRRLLVADLGPDPGNVDHQDGQPVIALVIRVRHRRHLLARRGMNKPHLVEGPAAR
jgi:hypothetical protein